MKDGIIFGNGAYKNTDYYKYFLDGRRNEFFIIAADGGLNFLDSINVIPDLIIGDLDSVDKELIDDYRGIPIEKYPEKKDFTDTEKALDYLLNHGYDTAFLFGNLSQDRIDHSLANIFLLEKYAKLGLDIQILNEDNILLCMVGPESFVLDEHPGSVISLISLSEEVTGLTLKGFEYPLEDSTLKRSSSLGISNVIAKPLPEISFDSGTLLIDIVLNF